MEDNTEELPVFPIQLIAEHTLWTQDVNWMYIKHSEDAQDVFLTSCVRLYTWLYVLKNKGRNLTPSSHCSNRLLQKPTRIIFSQRIYNPNTFIRLTMFVSELKAEKLDLNLSSIFTKLCFLEKHKPWRVWEINRK